jgi:flagellar biosynthetic protein FlhB
MLQHIPTPSLEHLMPKLSRVSPASGLSRVMGKDAVAQAVKSLAKLVIVGGVVSVALWGERANIARLPDMDMSAILDFARLALMHILMAVLAIHAFVAGGDYLFQWFSWQKRLMMSRQDLKDEYKQQEGNPEVKNKLRQLRRNFARRVMMGNVRKATVVIANPTHFAVALQYTEGMAAPICVAKGVDVLALRIRKLAEDHDVPVIEDRPLARSLYRLVEIDAEIPLDLYKPVAEIIGYVMRLRQRRAAPRPERQMRQP